MRKAVFPDALTHTNFDPVVFPTGAARVAASKPVILDNKKYTVDVIRSLEQQKQQLAIDRVQLNHANGRLVHEAERMKKQLAQAEEGYRNAIAALQAQTKARLDAEQAVVDLREGRGEAA